MTVKRQRFIAALLGLAVAMGGTAFAKDSDIFVNHKAVKKADFGTPGTNTLFYGSIYYQGSMGYKKPLNWVSFVQMNPAQEPMIVDPGYGKTSFFLQPVPIGTEFFLRAFQFEEGNTRYSIYIPIAKDTGMQMQATVPGLHYLGSYRSFSTDKKGPKTFFFGKNNFTLQNDGEIEELTTLQSIRSSFKKTAWLDLIDQRIQELTK